VKRRLLQVWAGRPGDEEPVRLGLAQALYSPPNPDMTRKRCANCVFWLGGMGPAGAEGGEGGEGARGGREACFLHEENVIVTADMICGYHVFGVSLGASVLPIRENLQAVTPELSGLEQVPDGTSCDNCRNYTPTPGHPSGLCQALYEPDSTAEYPVHPVVQNLGCCCAWAAQVS